MEKVIMQTSHGTTGYCCACDLIPGWVATGSKDFNKFKAEVQESVDTWLEWSREDKAEYSPVFDGEYELVFEFDTAALLAYYQGMITFAGIEQLTGINQRQLAHYAAGRRKPRIEQVRKIEEGLHRLGKELQSVSILN